MSITSTKLSPFIIRIVTFIIISFNILLFCAIYIYTTSQKVFNVSLLLNKPSFLFSKYRKSSNIVKYFYYLK